MGARYTSSVDSKHDTETPSPGDGLVVTFGATRKNDLRHDPVSEEYKNEDTKEFREWFSGPVTKPAPCQIWLGLNNIVLGNFVIDKGTMLLVGWLANDRCSSLLPHYAVGGDLLGVIVGE